MHAIRLATVVDAAAIHAMVLAIAEHVGERDHVESTVDDIVRHGFGPDPAFTVLLAVAVAVADNDNDNGKGGAVVGMSLFFPSFSTWRGTTGSYIQDFFVEPIARGSGLAGRLLAATAAHTAGGGGTYVRLSVDASNAVAQSFYGRAGMVEQRRERIFALDGEPFRRMAAPARD